MRAPKNRFFSIIFIVLAITLLFGCSQKKLTPHNALVVALDTEPSTLDPLFALDAYSQRINSLLYHALVEIDRNLKIVPSAALEVANPSPTTYRFKLREDLKFHDGSAVTATNFSNTLGKILDPQTASPFLTSFSDVKSVKIISPFVLEIELKNPRPSFLTDLTLVKALPLAFSKDNPVGSGPYRFVEKNSNEIILERNSLNRENLPKMERLIFKVVKDEQTRQLKLKKGEIDLIQNALNADSLSKLKNDPKLSMTISPGINYAYLGFNLMDPTLKQKKVREAIAYAIHRQEIIDHLLQGLAAPAKTVLSPLNWYYNDDVASYDHDIEKAKKLIQASGVVLPLKLLYKTSTDTESVNIARLMASHLKQIGIDVEIRTHEWGTFFNDIKTGNFQLFSLRWVGVTDPDIYYDIFHSSNVPPGKNRVYYKNKSLDKLLEQGRTTVDIEKRKEIYAKVQKIVAQDLPTVSLWHTNNVAVYSSKLEGFYFHPQANFSPFLHISKSP